MTFAPTTTPTGFGGAMEQTARVLSQLGNKDQPSKEFQNLVRQIGEAKTKHVSHF